jgi:hypothetical protein
MRTTDKRRLAYIEAIKVTHAETISEGKNTFSRKELRQVSDAHGWKWIPNWITHDLSRRVGRGVFSIPEAQGQDHDPAADSQSHKTGSDTETTETSSESMADDAEVRKILEAGTDASLQVPVGVADHGNA